MTHDAGGSQKHINTRPHRKLTFQPTHAAVTLGGTATRVAAHGFIGLHRPHMVPIASHRPSLPFDSKFSLDVYQLPIGIHWPYRTPPLALLTLQFQAGRPAVA
jgi:hypothetical protein